MCSLCLQSPCDYRCPNAKPSRSYQTCPYCGDGITLDEEYAEVNGEYFHIDCLESMGVRDLLEMFDCTVSRVVEEDLE